MTAEIVPWPNSKGDGGSGPEDPMLEQRVGALEQKTEKILSALDRLELASKEILSEQKDQRKQIFDLSMKVSGIEGQLKSAPNWIQLIGLTIATWTAGAGIVFTLTKFIHP